MGQQCCFNPSDIWYIRWDGFLILIDSCWMCTDRGILNIICQLFEVI